METKYSKCPDCGHTNKVEVPENFEDKVDQFLKSAPETIGKGLLSLGLGIFVAPPVGFVAAGAMLATSIFKDGTVKCTACGSRFRLM